MELNLAHRAISRGVRVRVASVRGLRRKRRGAAGTRGEVERSPARGGGRSADPIRATAVAPPAKHAEEPNAHLIFFYVLFKFGGGVSQNDFKTTGGTLTLVY